MPEAMKISDAKPAVDKDWEKLENASIVNDQTKQQKRRSSKRHKKSKKQSISLR